MPEFPRARKCLFPVAGYGTRFLPATKTIPKEMLPVVDKPLLQYGAEEAVEAGLVDLGFVTHRGKRAIEDHFDMAYELETEIAGTPREALLEGTRQLMSKARFAFTRQVTMQGLGHAILCGEPLIGHEPFGVVLPDDLCFGATPGRGVLRQMVELYEEFGCSIVAIQSVDPAETHRYGVVGGEEIRPGLIRVNQMVEKPEPSAAPSNLAIVGRYLLTPDIFDIIRNTPPGRNGEVQITDALMEQARAGRVLAWRFEGRRFDCGQVEGFVEATNYTFENVYQGASAQ